MGGQDDDDNPSTMLLEPATERVPAAFGEQRPPSAPPGQPVRVASVHTAPMAALPSLAATMALPAGMGPRPGATLALPPEALQPPEPSREGRAGTLIIDSASVLAAAGIVMPRAGAHGFPPPAAPAMPPPPAPAEVPSAPPRAPLESFNRETPPPAFESRLTAPVEPAVPIGVAAPLPAAPANVQVPQLPSGPPPVPRRSSAALWIVIGIVGTLAAAAALLVTGTIPSPWFAAAGRAPAPEPSSSAIASAEPLPSASESVAVPPTLPASADPAPSSMSSGSAEPSASQSASQSASSSVSASVSATASPAGSASTTVTAGDAYLLSHQGYLTVRSTTTAEVVVQGVVAGRTNTKMLVRCGQKKDVRLRKDGSWLNGGTAVLVTCMQHTTVTIQPLI